MLYDITRTVAATTAVFPGDTAYRAVPTLRLSAGDPVNLVTLTTTPHIGTHADAPYHYREGGAHPAALPLEPYIGAARVVTIARATGAITPADLPPGFSLAGVLRLLIHTRYSDLVDSAWDPTFPYPDVALIAWLAAQGVVLIGIDTPSFDDASSTDLPGHKELGRHGIANLENLFLRHVPDGVYDLFAPPLKLDAACGSPVRAVLRTPGA
ncbi:MAG: cyclase family protein [Anaerolineae bacterium]|nr:cyclase family protein [Anaerolineae bacterium]NUQ03289.1 cyclase family protein [Anaerolineae bacterium]